jgi:saccharopepsin
MNIEDHARALGQKYMGIRPSRHSEEMFKQAPHTSSGHNVLVDNFLNAQCTLLRL